MDRVRLLSQPEAEPTEALFEDLVTWICRGIEKLHGHLSGDKNYNPAWRTTPALTLKVSAGETARPPVPHHLCRGTEACLNTYLPLSFPGLIGNVSWRLSGAFRLGQHERRFADSTRFDLLVDGDHRIPPKAVVGLASRHVLGRILGPRDISAGESSPQFRLLLDRGFELVTKQTTIGTLDATFSVGRGPEGLFLLLESKGPARNVDYLKGLQALLYGLADLDATLESIAVDSRVTRGLPFEQRRVDLSSWTLPLRLHSVEDLPALRRAITAAVAVTARHPEASKGGGNPTKRIRISCSIPDDLSLFEVRELIAHTEEQPDITVGEFRFRPGAPTSSEVDTQRRTIGSTVVAHRHASMQKELYEDLIKIHGPSKVSAECMTSAGRPADLVVEVGGGYTTYEIKTAHSPRDCIQQALGQLLEYTCWPGSGRVPRCMWSARQHRIAAL